MINASIEDIVPFESDIEAFMIYLKHCQKMRTYTSVITQFDIMFTYKPSLSCKMMSCKNNTNYIIDSALSKG